jgi:hypothetical protein
MLQTQIFPSIPVGLLILIKLELSVAARIMLSLGQDAKNSTWPTIRTSTRHADTLLMGHERKLIRVNYAAEFLS